MKLPAIVFAWALCPFISKTQILPPAFVTCQSTGFQVVNNPSDFQTVNLATGTTTTERTFPIYINAMGYNPNDNRIYGIKLIAPFGLVVIGSDYSYQIIPTTGAALQSSAIGDVSPAGILWCAGSTNVYTVNCNPSAGVNFGKVTLLGPKPVVSITDWSFPPDDTSRIYSVTNNGSLIYFTTDLIVHTVMANGTVPAQSYGATFFDANQNFYAKGNTTGVIYKFVNATSNSPTVFAFSTSSASGQNDGARCADAPSPVIGDYGDAPNSFGTFASSGGPCHLLPSPDTTLARIYFGRAVSIDEDGSPSAGANLDADDGVDSFPLINGGPDSSLIAAYSVIISVHNSTASVANVSAWIDWNNNGTFDSVERVSDTVPANFTGQDTLTWLGITLSGPPGAAGTYARFRISTDTLKNPGGTVANGEVEDYFIPFIFVLPVSLFSFTAMKSGSSVHLNWTTASEQNSKGFSIERSSDGILFDQIGFVASQKGASVSGENLKYNYNDINPLAGINYYRLKQMDFEGKMIYSPVDKVIFGNEHNPVTVYPNPARDKIIIDGLKGNENVQLYNATGQLLKKEKANGITLTLDISKITTGVYRLMVTDAEGISFMQKIVKQR